MRKSRGAEQTHAHTRRIRRVGMRYRIAGVAGALLVIGGGSALGLAISAQRHAPQPSSSAAGSIGASTRHAAVLSLPRSEPVSIDIPAIGVRSRLLHLGLNPNGTLQVPPLFALPSEAAWYKYSPTPGQIGSSIIEGHVDTYKGPSVFFRLGALVPGDTVDVTLADGTVAVFRVTGVRSYPKTDWPWRTIFAQTHYAGLHLITCGGAFDYSTGHYLSNTVVFASLAGAKRPSASAKVAAQNSQAGHIEAAAGGSAG